MPDLLSRIIAIFSGRMVARGAQFFVFLLLARELDPAGFGVYGLLITSVLLASLLGSIGLRQAVAHWLGSRRLEHEQAGGTLLFLLPVLVVVAAGVVWIVIGPQLSSVASGIAVAVVLVAIAGSMAVMIFQGILLGLGRTTAFSISDSLYPLMLLACVALLYAIAGSVEFLPVILCVAGAQLVAGVVTIAAALVGSDRPQVVPFRTVRQLVAHGLAYSLNLFLITLSVRVSLYFIEYLMPADAVGQFFAGQRLGDLLVEAATAVGLVLFSDGVRSSDPAATLRRNARIAAGVFWTFMAAGIGISFLAGPITTVLLTGQYEAAGQVLAITAWSIGPAAATKIIYPSIAAMGRPLAGSPAIIASIAANVALCSLLIPAHGLAGAAVALVVSQFILLGGYIVVLTQVFGIGPRDSLRPVLPRFRNAS